MVYANYDEVFRELPPPPKGKVWKKVRAQDARGCLTKWELVELDEVRAGDPAEEVQGLQETAKKIMEETGFIEVGVVVGNSSRVFSTIGGGAGICTYHIGCSHTAHSTANRYNGRTKNQVQGHRC